jgi:uncharacterized coiled-coil protein SlyX
VSCIEQLEGVASVRAQQTVTVTLNNGKNIDFQAIFIMNNSKLDFIQSVSEQKQKADQLQTSLHRLSETLKAFEMTIEQSESLSLKTACFYSKSSGRQSPSNRI